MKEMQNEAEGYIFYIAVGSVAVAIVGYFLLLAVKSQNSRKPVKGNDKEYQKKINADNKRLETLRFIKEHGVHPDKASGNHLKKKFR